MEPLFGSPCEDPIAYGCARDRVAVLEPLRFAGAAEVQRQIALLRGWNVR